MLLVDVGLEDLALPETMEAELLLDVLAEDGADLDVAVAVEPVGVGEGRAVELPYPAIDSIAQGGTLGCALQGDHAIGHHQLRASIERCLRMVTSTSASSTRPTTPTACVIAA